MGGKKWISLLLALAMLLALPAGASAKKAKNPIALGTKLWLMQPEGTAQIQPKLRGVDAAELSFVSSDTGAVEVDNAGRLRAVSVGRAVITVSGGGASAKCGVVVLPAEINLKAGESIALPSEKQAKYKVKDGKIASVSKSGVIKAKKAGATALKVKADKQGVTVKLIVDGGASESSGQGISGLDAAKQADQVVLVAYTGGSKATLSVYEKRDGDWKKLWDTPAYVGKNGIGKTKEGDKKTPTGTFNLTTPFGIKDDPGANMAYTKVTKYHYWCGASDSDYYNQLVDSRETGRDYTSSDEHLIDYKGVYNYCMFIDYNAEGTPHKGSCIFLHCTGKKKYTAGCVAISEEKMKEIVKWARPGVKIVIGQAD